MTREELVKKSEELGNGYIEGISIEEAIDLAEAYAEARVRAFAEKLVDEATTEHFPDQEAIYFGDLRSVVSTTLATFLNPPNNEK